MECSRCEKATNVFCLTAEKQDTSTVSFCFLQRVQPLDSLQQACGIFWLGFFFLLNRDESRKKNTREYKGFLEHLIMYAKILVDVNKLSYGNSLENRKKCVGNWQHNRSDIVWSSFFPTVRKSFFAIRIDLPPGFLSSFSSVWV